MYRLTQQPIDVQLNDREVQQTLDFVEKLRENKSNHNVTDRMFDRNNTSEGIDIIGYLGETSVAKVLGLDIDTAIFKYGDTGNDLVLGNTTIQVKTSILPSLIFNSAELFKSDVAILTQFVGEDKRASQDDPRFKVWGWIEKGVFLQDYYPRDYGYGTRLVLDAVKLHTLDSLVEEALNIERWDMYVRSSVG